MIDQINFVTSVSYSPDGNYIVSSSGITINVWDSISYKLIANLNGISNKIDILFLIIIK